MEIRDEREGDKEAIRRVHLDAFGGDLEARLVELLRDRGNAIASLVAVSDGDVVGHVMFSPMTIERAEGDLIFLVGHPRYYSRFGFTHAKAFGFGNEYGVDEEFMVLELQDGALTRAGGLVRYAPEFAEVSC